MIVCTWLWLFLLPPSSLDLIVNVFGIFSLSLCVWVGVSLFCFLSLSLTLSGPSRIKPSRGDKEEYKRIDSVVLLNESIGQSIRAVVGRTRWNETKRNETGSR